MATVGSSSLEIKGLLPAFRSLFLKTSELSTGVCFASDGSGLDKEVIWVEDQVKDFQKYIEKLNEITNAVILILSGNDDIFITYFATPARRPSIRFTTAKPCFCSLMTQIPCINSASHVFWDFGHSSEKAYLTVLPDVLTEILNLVRPGSRR
ncbi:hypothetical protein EUTSA_v10000660mg [Eutrema salsugineum]|uniref:Uncharacterized protein n=1 Tax=Eutrema salsugineum TaxID=72664 RepID=V4LVN4_EUTSA|nr:hypothetical protein EUTSA_v10000660mg [Eutrema salsugineum]